MISPRKYLRHALTLLTLSFLAAPAFAVSKEMIQLQTQVQALQDAVARLQQTNDEGMGVMKSLVQQNADSVNKMSVTMENVARTLQTQNDAQGGKLDQLSGQLQSLNDSLDEMKTRLARLEKLTQDIQNQQQSLAAGPAAASAAPTAQPETALPATPPTAFNPTPSALAGRRGKPSAALPMDTPAAASAPAAAAPAIDDLYKSALGDYMAAKYPLAAGEFADVIRYYPDAPLAGNSFYYLGEIDYRAAKYEDAAKDYDMVLQHFPSNPKVAPARLHKGQALIALKQDDAAVREWRALIQRYPNSPEASLARSKLTNMGITPPRRQ